MDQSLSQYRIFYEVARLGNISKAAKELYISQPAISKAISKLENNLDVTLFTRNSRGVQLTYEGRMLFEHTKTAFESLTRGENELKKIRDFHIGYIRIGGSATLCKFILLDYLKSFIESYPHTRITIENHSTAVTLSMLEQQQIDIGLIAEPKSKRSLVFLPLLETEDIFVATPAYLANLKLREGESTDIFHTANIMLLDTNNLTRNYIDEYFLNHHIEVNQILEVSTMDLLIEFCRIGLGIGCVIKEFVQKDLDEGRLVQVPLQTNIHKRKIGLAYSQVTSSGALKNFLDFFEAAVGKLGL